jgi:H+/gluconate symporter-like permease
MPILLPVGLVSANTIVSVFAKTAAEDSSLRSFADTVAVLGNVNLAMLLAATIAMWMLKSKRSLSLAQLGKIVEGSLMSGGIVILITAGGGAFGAMLKAAEVGPAIKQLFGQSGGDATGGIMLLILGAIIASVMKISQGSGTVAMITASSMIAAMIPSMDSLGYHPAYLATAIGGGSMICSWMNDSGFWIFVKMTGLTEAEGLKSWTFQLAVMGLVAVGVSLILAVVLPLA